jgi:CSLREA domain-containing protein
VPDFGRYVLSVAETEVKNANGLNVPTDSFGEFLVRVTDPAVIYVNRFADSVDANVGNGVCADSSGDCSLRAAIQEANAAAPASRTIVLDEGTYELDLPPVPDATNSFPVPEGNTWCFVGARGFESSDERSGDLDIRGNVTILGNQASATTIDGGRLDRVFKVYPGSSLVLNRATVTGGQALDGSGILSAGSLSLDLVKLTANSALRGGGSIAVWNGHTEIERSMILENDALHGGGVFVCNGATVDISSSTIAKNVASIDGGGLYSSFGGAIQVTNSTISENRSPVGGSAIVNPVHLGKAAAGDSYSTDDRFHVYDLDDHLYVRDRQTGRYEQVDVSNEGVSGNNPSQFDAFFHPSISKDGRLVAFHAN